MKLLGPEHVVAVGLTAALAAAGVWAARSRPGPWTVTASRVLAGVMLGAYLVEHLAHAVRGDWRPTLNLPLHLTDAVTLVAVLALIRPRPLLVELTYFWGLTASLLAVLTPEIAYGFPDVYFFTFFATHAGAVIAAAFLVFGRGLRPRPGAVRRAYAATAAVAAAAALGNLATGGNYMYLRRKPRTDTLLDLLGPWPVYIAAAAVLALALFAALYLPFRRRAAIAG